MDKIPENEIDQENQNSNNLPRTEEEKSSEDVFPSEEEKPSKDVSLPEEDIPNAGISKSEEDNSDEDNSKTAVQEEINEINIDKSSDSTIVIGSGRIKKKAFNNFGEIYNQSLYFGDTISFIDRMPAEKEKINEVFVEPDEYHTVFTDFQKHNQRIVVFSGNENSGRFAAAVKFGVDIQRIDKNAKKIVSCRTETAQLLDIVFDKRFAEGTVCICSNLSKDTAIQKGYFDEINLIQEKLREKSSYLLITVLDDDEVRANLSLRYLNILNISYEKKIFQDVLEKHLAYYSKQYKWSLEKVRIVKSAITRLDSKENDIAVNPVLIDNLLSKLISYEWTAESMDESTMQKEIDDLLEQIVNKSIIFLNNQAINPNVWFSQLNENQRLFVLLARLFEYMDFDEFEQLYFEVVTYLRNDRYPLIDPRRIGIYELVASTQIIITDNQIEINSAFYEEIDRQIENRYYLLSSLLELFTKHIVEKRGKQYAQLRRAYGIAIGWISFHQQSYLNKNLSYLADFNSNEVSAVPGYALLEVCLKNRENCSMALEIIEGWSRERKGDFLWAATASIWRLYNGFNSKKDIYFDEIQQLWNLLQFIGNRIISDETIKDDENEQFRQIHAFFFTINNIAKDNLEDVIEHLLNWINGSDEDLHIIACLSAFTLFEDFDVTKRRIINNNKFYLLKLIEPLLKYPDLLIEMNTILYILLWLECDGWESKHRDVTNFFIELSDHLSSQKRNILKLLLLNIWFSDSSTSMRTRKVGIDILQHVYILQGSPILIDDNPLIYFSIDRSIQQLYHEYHFDPTVLFDILSIRGNIYASFLGGLDQIDRQEIETSTYYGYLEPLPALLCASLENYLQKDRAPYLMVNYGSREIIDIDDLDSFDLNDIFLYFSPLSLKMKSEKQKGYGINNFQDDLLDFDDFDDQIDAILISQILQLTTDVLRGQIALFWPDVQLDAPKSLIEKINLLLSDKGNLFSGVNSNILHVITSCIWLFKENQNLLISQLNSWFSEQNGQIDKSIPIGVFRLLLKMAIQAPKEDWQGQYAELIGLLDDLYPLSNDPHTIFEIHKYLFRLLVEVDNVKFERQYICYENLKVDYVALLKTIDSHAAKALSLWIQTSDEKMQDANDKARLYQKFIFLLQAAQAVDIPDLEEGQKYGLFLIQSRTKNEEAWPELAITLDWVQQINEYKENQKIMPIVFQMGQISPLLAGDMIPLEEMIDWNENDDLPLLTAPIMERFSQEEIQFIFLISEKSIIDVDDWLDLSWQSRKIPVISWSYNDSTSEKNIAGVMHFSGKGKTIGDILKLWGMNNPE